jgi:hypothetical protein
MKIQAFLPLVTYPDTNSDAAAANATAVAEHLSADFHALALNADRNFHSHRPVARGFLPRGLSYACRRPKLFTKAASPLS